MKTRRLKYREAISEATVQCMAADESIFVVGIGVDDIKGVFDTTRDAFQRFGGSRVFDIPNCENAMAGICIGAAASGMRPLWVHPRNDFMFLATDQIINLAAKWKYMFAKDRGIPIVIRGIVGRGWGQGATHSQSTHSLFAHFPGLYVGMPATPADAKGMMVTALQGETTTILLEHRSLYELEGEVPVELFSIPVGKGSVLRTGEDVTVVATSIMAHEAERAAERLAEHGISLEVINPRSIRPVDVDLIVSSLKKTGRLVVADTSWALCGFSAEVAAIASEHCHDALKAPVRRLTQLDCPAPVSRPLEEAFHPNCGSIVNACLELLRNDATVEKTLPSLHAEFTGPY
jgi:pyruvate dehydrogenase E1 component beta subunit